MKKIIALTILINYDYKFVIMSKKTYLKTALTKEQRKRKWRKQSKFKLKIWGRLKKNNHETNNKFWCMGNLKYYFIVH